MKTMKPLQNILINKLNAILIIIDMQNEFCKRGGKLYSRTSAQIMPRIISTTHKLADRFHSVGIPIIYIQSIRTREEPDIAAFDIRPHLKIVKIGTWAAEIINELKPRAQDIIVPKFSHDPFFNTELDRTLQELVPDSTRFFAIVTGGAVNVCLYHAVMGFYLRNYLTVVPVDCVYYSNKSAKQIALKQFSLQAYPTIILSRSDLINVSVQQAVISPASPSII